MELCVCLVSSCPFAPILLLCPDSYSSGVRVETMASSMLRTLVLALLVVVGLLATQAQAKITYVKPAWKYPDEFSPAEGE